MLKHQSRRKKLIALLAIFSLALASQVAISSSSTAAPKCKPVKALGKTVGKITIGKLVMPIKAFNYPAGGIMEPQASTLMAGLSERHMPLSSNVGTSVVVWHVNYNGCWNNLNILMSKKKGFKFSLTDENGKTTKYVLNKKLVVTKGKYQKDWFNLIGPRQIAMFTCTGAFKNGHYTQNMVFIATPVGARSTTSI